VGAARGEHRRRSASSQSPPVPEVLEHVATLTGFRDRGLLDVTLVTGLMDLLQPSRVTMYRVVGEADDPRWHCRASMSRGDLVAASGSLWVDPLVLPKLDSMPLHARALHQGEPLEQSTGGEHVTVFSVATDREVLGVVEIVRERALTRNGRKRVSALLRIYRNFHSLLDYSERDTLTGLLNRKSFDETFLRAATEGMSSASTPADAERRISQPRLRPWLGVVDIDHFKSVNDRYGHLIGDEVLVLMARIMRTTFRLQDQLYRFGGEEFVVLLRSPDEDSATVAFERLRSNLEHFRFPQVGMVTGSIGFTELSSSDTPAAAVERADRALYYAKEHGRNQVCSYAELVRTGALSDKHAIGDIELF
jgi:diguanylate cyclase (GGDEF)-like protein